MSVQISPQGYQITKEPVNQNPFWQNESQVIGIVSVDMVEQPTVDGTDYVFTYTDVDGHMETIGTVSVPDGIDDPPVFIPSITNGILSWSNNAGLPNPNPINVVGAKGDDGLSASVQVGTVTTGAAGSNAQVVNVGTTQNAILNFTIPAGAKGDTGSTPNITASATVDNNTGTPSVVVTKSGDNFAFAFSNLKGAAGSTPNITASATVDNNTGTPGVSVTKVGDNLAFAFTNLKGAKGDTPTITATASVDSGTGTPAVNVTKTGDNIDFAFSNLKGAAGSTPNITATAQVGSGTGTPSVSVTKSGDNFDFAFDNLKGTQGADGNGVIAGGTTGQVLSKHSDTDYDTEWRDVREVPSYVAGDAGKALKVNAGGNGLEWGAAGGGSADTWHPFDQRTYIDNNRVNIADNITAVDSSGNDIIFEEGTYLITLFANPPFNSGGSSHFGDVLCGQVMINVEAGVYRSCAASALSPSGYAYIAATVTTDSKLKVCVNEINSSGKTYINARDRVTLDSHTGDLFWAKIA